MDPGGHDVKSQVAEMRAAIASIHASARTAKKVRIVGLLAAFGVVAYYLYLFIDLGRSAFQPSELARVAQERVGRIDLIGGLKTVVQEAGPVYANEARRVAEEVKLKEVAAQEFQAFVKDLKPMLLAQVERIRPQFERTLENEGELTSTQLQQRLTDLLVSRINGVLQKHKDEIGRKTKMTAAEVDEAMMFLLEANKLAIVNLVQKRWGNNTQKLEEISEHVRSLPPLPPMSEQQMVEETGDVLIALLKYKLPDYEVKEVAR